MGGLREVAAPFVVPGPTGVAIRTRLKGLTPEDEEVLRLVGAHLGSLASRDLKVRCADGLEHSAETWAVRKRELTPLSSSRWAGSITKATHDQWALARRGQAAHVQSLEAGVRTIRHRLSLPLGEKGGKRAPGGYRSQGEWFHKSRRLHVLQDRLTAVRTDREAGVVRVVRGGRRLLTTRHHLEEARLTETQWRERWEAGRWFLQADGESGKRYGNETIRVAPDGEVSIKLPAPLAAHANSGHGRYVLAAPVFFPHRGTEWADRVEANRAVAYRIHHDTARGRWYLTAAWTFPVTRTIPLAAALAEGVIGVDTNADHLAAWRLDPHGNPIGSPRRFFYDLSGTADHRDAQVRHALTRLLNWARSCGVKAIAVEDLDFTAEKTREKHGRKKRFKQLISGMPTRKLRARLTSMADRTGIAIIAVDPAYTSMWGAQHWQKPLTTKTRRTTRHDAASIAIGRRAQGHPIRRRTAPPRDEQSDRRGHRTVQARPETLGREGPRLRVPGPRTRCEPPDAARTRATRTPNTVRDARSDQAWVQDPLLLTE
ncbi:IS200/IS605 family element transposase accessory protein TnpB [Streptomyces niveiscabiei]|uniref:IS200/IS605 family element transposase accessory protein TnpB n=1 Tax=Streptomyces niveiscabiei TaxID=164115 RepID=UPI0006EB5DCF|nr:IS200/IS605 family element transposase accessory protein TnpB [Streptomyces niveiscabiei]